MHFTTFFTRVFVVIAAWGIFACRTPVSQGSSDDVSLNRLQRYALEARLMNDRIRGLEETCSLLERRYVMLLTSFFPVGTIAPVLVSNVSLSHLVLDQKIMRPAVRITWIDLSGSGVVISSRSDGKYRGTYIITSYHLLREFLKRAQGAVPPPPVEVEIFSLNDNGASASRPTVRAGTADVFGNPRYITEEADVVCFDEGSDLALLKLRCQHLYPSAVLLPRERRGEVDVFASVYAVGCPLGNDPIPTLGQLGSMINIINQHNYWLITAPTHFGNSGGGVYLASSGELIGIFSKITTQGLAKPPVAISHMGFVTPLEVVIEFLEKNGYPFFLSALPASAPVRATDAS